jgi:hypothetical protein
MVTRYIQSDIVANGRYTGANLHQLRIWLSKNLISKLNYLIIRDVQCLLAHHGVQSLGLIRKVNMKRVSQDMPEALAKWSKLDGILSVDFPRIGEYINRLQYFNWTTNFASSRSTTYSLKSRRALTMYPWTTSINGRMRQPTPVSQKTRKTRKTSQWKMVRWKTTSGRNMSLTLTTSSKWILKLPWLCPTPLRSGRVDRTSRSSKTSQHLLELSSHKPHLLHSKFFEKRPTSHETHSRAVWASLPHSRRSYNRTHPFTARTSHKIHVHLKTRFRQLLPPNKPPPPKQVAFNHLLPTHFLIYSR